jgi:two-component system sporulation sensor kinase A
MRKNHLGNKTFAAMHMGKDLIVSNESVFDALIESANIPITLISMTGKCVKMNAPFTALTGYTKEELLNSNLSQLAYQNESVFHLGSMSELWKDNIRYSQFEQRWVHRSGADIWVQINLSIIRNSRHRPIYWLVHIIDQTKHKRMEIDLQQTKSFLESFLNHTTDAICVLDLNDCVISVNSTFEQMFGRKKEELLGMELPSYPDYIQNRHSEIFGLLHKGKKISGLETVQKRQDGQSIDVSVTIAPINNEVGDMIAYTVIIRDISERKKMDELLFKSDKLSAAGQLAAGLAHEIRNPLTSLRGFLQLMQGDSHSKKDYFDIMLSEVDRINVIVSEFLVIAKPEDYNFKESDLLDILQSVVALLETQALLCGIQLFLHVQTVHTQIICSKQHLKQLFINLIKNAMEASPKESEIHIEAYMPDDEHILIRTMDRGIGIPQEKIAQIGQPFYTTKEKGTGLGLMMCNKIVEAHRGSLMITSEFGQGTTVDVILPIKLNHE